MFSFSQSTTVVISQFYGAGGNTGATFNADFVELHNVSNAAVSLSGMSIQYSSATNTGVWTGVSPLPAASIPAGGYYLIQMSTPGANGAAIPVADYVSNPTIAMSGTNGKLALVNALTALTGCPTDPTIIDLVGYGTANCFEGAAATAVLTSTTGGIRNNNGCAETNNNGADFTVAAVTPRNSASPVFVCAGGPPTPGLVAGTVVDFGSVIVLTNSPSQNFNLSGTNLTGAPGIITVTAPSTDFQVSNDNSSFGATTTIAYSAATLAATPVYVRFTPQTAGPKSGNVTITGGGVTTAVNVAVSGNGTATAAPNVTSTTPAAFGDICLNTTAGPNNFDITGANLTVADLVVGPLAGYAFSLSPGGPFTPTLTLVHGAGNYNQTIFVEFTPTTATNYSGNIPVSGGGLAAPANVAVSGSGSAGTATVVTGSPSAITQTSATLNGSLPAQGCSPVTVWGFEYSTVSGFVNGTVANSATLTGTDFSAGIASLLPGTTYYYKAFATNASGTVYGMEMSFITSAPPPASLSATGLADFGSTCVGASVGPNSFDISGVNLTTADITVGPFAGYSFSTTATGTFTPTLTLTQGGGTYNQTVYVKFTPTALGSFNGNIPVTGGGVASFSVPVTGAANNASAAPLTGDATQVTVHGAVAPGTIPASSCSPAISYGIEFSGINGFADGTGTKIESTNLSGTDFTSTLSGLVQNTTYYYKAYAINSGGTAYGAQKSFTTGSLGGGLIIYGNPVIRGTSLHYSLTGLKRGHYSARIHNSIGQLVYQKDIIIQVNFIDDSFILPSNLPGGLYNLEIRNYEYKIQKSFYVQ